MILDKKQDIIRCQKCNLIPLINFYLSTYDIKLLFKCRNNHEIEEDLYEYIDNKLSSLKINQEDSICLLHNEKISLICNKCKKNFCKKCSFKDCETISIDNYSITKNEKEIIENNIVKYEPFIEKVNNTIDEGVGTYVQDRDFLKSYIEEFLKINNYLIKFAKIIYFAYIHNEKCLSYEIIQNCKNNLNFNYNDLLLDGYTRNNPDESLGQAEWFFRIFEKKRLYYNIINSYLNKKSNYILLPYKEEVDLTKIKSIKKMRFISENKESWYYRNFTELNDGRLAMCSEIQIDIFKLNTLDLDFIIKPPKEKNEDKKKNKEKDEDKKDENDEKDEEDEEDEKDEDNKDKDDEDIRFFFDEIVGLNNGNLVAITEKCNITIYKIKDKNYEIIDTIKGKEKLFKIIELHDNSIIIFKSKTIIQYKLIDGKYKEIKQIKNKLIPEEGDSRSILKEFKDHSKILLYSDKKLIYFNMKGEFELKKEFERGYGMLWDFLGKDYLLQGFGDIYIKDINSLKEIAYQECGEKFDYEVECLCSLKDNSFLCGLSNRFGCILKQYVFKGKTIEEIASMSFSSYKEDFNNIYQLKNGNIVGTITTGEYFLFTQK